MSALSIACPHCGVENTAGGSFCKACGKALPSKSPTVPRVVKGNRLSDVRVDAAAPNDPAPKLLKRADGALAMMVFVNGIWLALSVLRLTRHTTHYPEWSWQDLFYSGVMLVTYCGLRIWSRRKLKAACAAGIVVCLLGALLNVPVAISRSAQFTHGTGKTAGVRMFIADLFLILVLVDGWLCAKKYERLHEQVGDT